MDLMEKVVTILKRKWLIILLAILLLIFTLLGYIIFQTVNEKPPDFFSFDNKFATYTIKKEDANYFVVFNAKPGSNKHYTCTWVESKANCQWENNDNVEILVANSNNSLDPFIGKSLKIRGDFVNATKQCIAGKCGQVFGPFVGVNISIIEVLK